MNPGLRCAPFEFEVFEWGLEVSGPAAGFQVGSRQDSWNYESIAIISGTCRACQHPFAILQFLPTRRKRVCLKPCKRHMYRVSMRPNLLITFRG